MRKRIWLAWVLAIAVAAFIGALWALWRLAAPQMVTLSNGDRYRLAGVTWGTNHLEPTLAARVAKRIPSPLTNVFQRTLGKRLGPVTSFRTAEPSLFVWFRPLATSGQSSSLDPLRAVLADQNSLAGTSPGAMPGGFQWAITARPTTPASGGNTQYGAATFTAVPRRSPILQCVLFQPTESGILREVGRVRFSNPLFGQFPQWQPETLPATKSAGDFDVQLQNIWIEGIDAGLGPTALPPNWIRMRASQPALKGEQGVFTVFNLSLRSSSGTGERYEIVSSELSDATGNHIHGFRDPIPTEAQRTMQDDGYVNVIGGVLWPDEAAWRLKVELKRDSGFSAPELVTFKSVPLLNEGTPDVIRLTNLVGGTQFVLSERMQIQNGRNPGRPRFQFETAARPNSISLAWVKVATDAVAEAETSKPSWSQGYSPGRPDGNAHFSSDLVLRFVPAGVKTVDITWAMHKTRTVEFLVKPPKRE